ncbi:hypothetical protein VaNZ11_008119 [Volvox africanus]|uniref:Uncharacterized protein n=1 Tax=Volvox africanus TaxID=51714 RepID=A0ABQ5S652_9CHLO|nr:hypothetical protein VaNZ11_008119 [Volvox africanus]
MKETLRPIALKQAWEVANGEEVKFVYGGFASEKTSGDFHALVTQALVVPNRASVIGDPGPFGLLCFGMTTCMLMFIYTGWAESNFLPTVMCYAMFYGGFGQFVAGVLELIRGNTFGGTAFCSYGAFWMGWFLLEFLSHQDADAYPLARVGKTLWCALWALLTGGLFVTTLCKNGCLMTIFSSLVVTFILLAGGEWSDKCHQAAGYVGFFCGASAIYAAFAFLYEMELGIFLPGVRPLNCLPGALLHPGAAVQPAPENGGCAVVMVAGNSDEEDPKKETAPKELLGPTLRQRQQAGGPREAAGLAAPAPAPTAAAAVVEAK